jgi:hypothetical protein
VIKKKKKKKMFRLLHEPLEPLFRVQRRAQRWQLLLERVLLHATLTFPLQHLMQSEEHVLV